MEQTTEQQAILDDMAGKPGGKPAPKAEKPIPDGPRRYVALPGYTLIGVEQFPFETDDEEIQGLVEKSRGFRRGKIWIERRNSEEREAAESALDGLNFHQLRKMAAALGHENVQRFKKIELIDILEKEGF
ncbi:MAG: hypothetical protein KAJ06_09270 [Gammaproteobacteria bacterium]|nr:hypothetical protein [Gammaproteobacteria bacterium]